MTEEEALKLVHGDLLVITGIDFPANRRILLESASGYSDLFLLGEIVMVRDDFFEAFGAGPITLEEVHITNAHHFGGRLRVYISGERTRMGGWPISHVERASEFHLTNATRPNIKKEERSW
jgi:hypothetical protein